MDASDSDSSDPLRPSSPDEFTPCGNPQKAELPIICHAKPVYWWAIVVGLPEAAFMLLGPFFLFNDGPEPHPSTWPLALLTCPVGITMALAVLWAVFDLLRGEIRADVTGLTWRRGFTGWKSARWDEITDFYLRHHSSPKTYLVETSAGKLELSSSFRGIDQIATIVVAEAGHTNNRGWEVKGMRPREEWSRTFWVWSGDQKWFAPLETGLILFLLSFLVAAVATSAQEPHRLGFWLDTFPVLLGCAFLLPLLVVVGWALHYLWRDWKRARAHRDEKLEVDARGLHFSSRSQSVAAKWEEVTAVTFLPPEKGVMQVQIETLRGNFIVWGGNGLRIWSKFQPILLQYAPWTMEDHEEASYKRVLLENDLQGEQGAWSGGAAGVGKRRWGFRSRGARLSCLCASLVLSLVPFFYIGGIENSASPDIEVPIIFPWRHFAAVCALCCFAIVIGWLWFYRAAVLADDDGLEVRSFFLRPRRATWPSIESIGRDMWGEFVLVGKRKLYFTQLFPPVRIEELRAFIGEHISR